MALTFIPETGQGIPNANSYVTVEEADAYLEANIHAWTSWSVLDTDVKEALLIWSTRYLDQRVDWNGGLTTQGQSLRWPRERVRDADGFWVDNDVIPSQLKAAVIELAYSLLTTDPTAPTSSAGLEKLKVDVIELQFTKYYTAAAVPSNVLALLAGLGTFRGVGGFAKIKRS